MVQKAARFADQESRRLKPVVLPEDHMGYTLQPSGGAGMVNNVSSPLAPLRSTVQQNGSNGRFSADTLPTDGVAETADKTTAFSQPSRTVQRVSWTPRNYTKIAEFFSVPREKSTAASSTDINVHFSQSFNTWSGWIDPHSDLESVLTKPQPKNAQPPLELPELTTEDEKLLLTDIFRDLKNMNSDGIHERLHLPPPTELSNRLKITSVVSVASSRHCRDESDSDSDAPETWTCLPGGCHFK